MDAYFLLLQDEESLRLTGTQAAFTREQAARWLASMGDREGRVDLAILLRETDELMGEVVLKDIDVTNRSASLRIGLRTPFTSQGYGTEALQLMLAHAFETLHLHRVELEVFAFNPRARHVYARLGFRQEGVRREVLWWDGAWHDAILMSLLAPEYSAHKAR